MASKLGQGRMVSPSMAVDWLFPSGSVISTVNNKARINDKPSTPVTIPWCGENMVVGDGD